MASFAEPRAERLYGSNLLSCDFQGRTPLFTDFANKAGSGKS